MSALVEALQSVENQAKGTKWKRFLNHPWRYCQAIGFRTLVYPWTKKGRLAVAPLFFGGRMSVLLPAATDIFLTGGKTHDSEVRLARFLIQHLSEGQVFFDIGAHFGYFSRLAAHLVGSKGRVFAFEAAQGSFELLAKNTADCPQIERTQAAVYDAVGTVIFYEFPILYSEYNTAHAQQYAQEHWFQSLKPVEREVPTVVLQDFITAHQAQPNIIKIDVEGAEYQVIKGLDRYLDTLSVFIVMEFVSAARGNANHLAAQSFLAEKGFYPHTIDASGALVVVTDVEAYLAAQKSDSDNIVFCKK